MNSAVQIAPTRAVRGDAAAKKPASGGEDVAGFATALGNLAKDDARSREGTGETAAGSAATGAAQPQKTVTKTPAALFAELFALPEPRPQNTSPGDEIAAAMEQDADADDAQETQAESDGLAKKKAATDDHAAATPLIGTVIAVKEVARAPQGASGIADDGTAALVALFSKPRKSGDTANAANPANANPVAKGTQGAAASKLPTDAAPPEMQADGDAVEAEVKTAARIADAGGASTVAKDAEPGLSDKENPLTGVKVVSLHTTLAPTTPFAHPAAAPTAAALASSIHAGLEAQATRAPVPLLDQPSAPTTMQTLKIQLQPNSLGTVTAQLHLAGDALRVELRVDSAEARHRLTSDSDTIVKSLRALGYDVDHVTIQTVSAPAPTAPSNGQNAIAGGRDQSFQQPAGSNSNGQGSSHAGSGRGNGEQSSRHPTERAEQGGSAGSGLFI